MANVLSSEALFYACIIPFIIFFGSFAALLYPMRDALHPTGEPFCLAPEPAVPCKHEKHGCMMKPDGWILHVGLQCLGVLKRSSVEM